MSRQTTIWFRRASDAQNSEEAFVALFEIDHEDIIGGPIRIASDGNIRVSDDPPRYVTRHQGNDYTLTLIGAIIPTDRDRAPAATQIVFDNVDADFGGLLRSILTPMSVTMKVVLASRPDEIVADWTGLLGVKASIDKNLVSIDLTGKNFEEQPCPAARMTADRFPALHR